MRQWRHPCDADGASFLTHAGLGGRTASTSLTLREFVRPARIRQFCDRQTGRVPPFYDWRLPDASHLRGYVLLEFCGFKWRGRSVGRFGRRLP